MSIDAKHWNRRPIISLAVASLLVAFTVIVTVFLVVTQAKSDATKEVSLASSASIVPFDTFTFVSFNPHLDQTDSFDVTKQAWTDTTLLKEALTEFQRLIKVENLDLAAEISPWMGNEMSFAIVGDIVSLVSKEVSWGKTALVISKAMPEMVVAISTQDRAASNQFLDQLGAGMDEKNTAFLETDYKDVKVFYTEPIHEGDWGVAYATFDDWVVLTTGGLETMKTIIDASQEGPTLAENPDYAAVLERLPPDQVGYAYLDLDTYIQAGLAAAGPELEEIPIEALDSNDLRAFKKIGFSVDLEPNGVHVNMVMTFDQGTPLSEIVGTKSIPNSAANFVPDSTFFYCSTSGLDQIVQVGLDIVKSNPDLAMPNFDQSIELLEGILGIKVQDLLNMLSGEFALALNPGPSQVAEASSLPLGLSLLIEAKHYTEYEELLAKIAVMMKRFTDINVSAKFIDDAQAWTLEDPVTKGTLAAWGVDENFFILASAEELLKVAFGDRGAKLADDAIYQAVMDALPDTGGVFLYVDLNKFGGLVGQNMSPEEQEKNNQTDPDFVDSIKALGFVSEPLKPEKGAVSSELFVLIGSAD